MCQEKRRVLFMSLVVMSPQDGGSSLKHCKDPLKQALQPLIFNDHQQREHTAQLLCTKMPVQSATGQQQVTCPAGASLSSSWQQGRFQELQNCTTLVVSSFNHQLRNSFCYNLNKKKKDQNHQTTAPSLGPSHGRSAVWGQPDGCSRALPAVFQLCWRPCWQVCRLR